ncbi:MAG: XisH family protein [Deltaproteobacteria bacterium]|nr:XisH family protein [Deltaproteobacteria bacterium]
MPQRDLVHGVVRAALERDQWVITHDPLLLHGGSHNLYVDLGADRVLGAEREAQKIAVEVKSFSGRSEITELERALGQYVLYETLLRKSHPGRVLLLAVPASVFESLLSSELGMTLRESFPLRLLVFDPVAGEVRRWVW